MLSAWDGWVHSVLNSMSAWNNRSNCDKKKFHEMRSFEAFGVQSSFRDSGPSSLPSSFYAEKKNLSPQFSPFSSRSFLSLQCGLNSFDVGLGQENVGLSPFVRNTWSRSNSLYGGSSRYSSGNMSIDWSETVDRVFLEEMKLMAKGF